MTEKTDRESAMHAGHRQRMRERFRRQGLEGFAPHEVLELLLFYSRPRGDVNAMAHRLLDNFGSLRGVLEASTDQLCRVDGVGEETATLLSLMLPMFRRYSECLMEEEQRISNRVEAQRYCAGLMAGRRTEQFFVICLSADGHVLGRRMIAEGSLTEVHTYPRVVAETVLNYNAHSVLLCHNHPGGRVAPSQTDVETTKHLCTMLATLGVTMLDHLIVSGDKVCSMLQSGFLSFDDGVNMPGRVVGSSAEKVLPAKKTGEEN